MKAMHDESATLGTVAALLDDASLGRLEQAALQLDGEFVQDIWKSLSACA